jgi:hypothetical protein
VTLPDVGEITGTITSVLSTGGLPSIVPDLGTITSVLPTGGSGLPDLGTIINGVLPDAGLPLPAGGASTGSLPIPNLPSAAPVQTIVPTVINAVTPILSTVQSALPTGALPTGDLPLGSVVDQGRGLAAPALAPIIGVIDQLGQTVDSLVPQAAPVVDPLLGTVTALPDQVAGLLSTVLTNPQAPAPVVQVPTPSVGVSAEVTTPQAGVGLQVESNQPRAAQAAQNVTPAGAAAPAGAADAAPAAAKNGRAASAGGDSLPITGIGIAGVGLAGAIALSWGVLARTLAARRRPLES